MTLFGRNMMGCGSEKSSPIRIIVYLYLFRSNRTITTRLNRMLDMGIIKAHGSSHDPKRSYSMVYRESSK